MAAEEDKESSADGAKPKKKKSKLLFIIIGVVVLIVIGVVAFLFLGGSKDEDGEEKPVEIKYETVQLKPFIVNLTDNVSYLKVTLLLEYDPTLVGAPSGILSGGGGTNFDTLTNNLPGALKDREPMIRDAIINILAAKSRQDLLSAEGREALKEELIEAANDAAGLDEAPIIGIYFVEFVIQ